MSEKISEWRDYPVIDGNGELVCQHGNPVPGHCDSCDYIVAPVPADVVVQLSGEDGNAFAIIARVSEALKRAGFRDEAEAFVKQATSCGSYDELLRLAMETVDCQ